MNTSMSISEIDLESVYGSMGLIREYRDALRSCPLGEDQNTWNVFMPKGVNCEKLLLGYKRAGLLLFDYYEKEGWDTVITHNDRNPDEGNYVVSFSRNIEAEEMDPFLSGDEVFALYPGQCITFLERGVLGLGYWYANKSHLDTWTATLCAGSIIQEKVGEKIETRYPYYRFMTNIPCPRNKLCSCEGTMSAVTLRPRFWVCYRRCA